MPKPSQSSEPQKMYTVWNSTIKRKAPLPKGRVPIKKSGKPIARTAKIKPVGAKRAARLKIWGPMRDQLLIDKPFCMANISEGCTKEDPRPSTQVHHKGGRENDHIIDPNNLIPICDECHRHATEHSADAIKKGISVSRHSLPTPNHLRHND